MKILLTGGGTGGHITPLLAVAHKLKSIRPDTEIIYIGEHGNRFASMLEGQTVFDKQYKIYAGKFRRYNGESWLRRVVDIKTNLLNVRDAFLAGIGVVQSIFLLRKLRPDVILLKGGFVGMPVGLAAATLHIPFITHDSDALPGLANRLVGRWARYHATGMPADFYTYPPDMVKHVGVLVGDQYQLVTPELQQQYRQELQIPADALVLMITGGSSGAQVINKAVAACMPDLLGELPKLYVLHQVGQGKEGVYGDFRHERLRVEPLIREMYRYSGAADVIITRAGATAIAEFGIQGKACIVVPNPLLTGGHQLKNAEHLAQADAIVVVHEAGLEAEQGRSLYTAVVDLLQNEPRRKQLGENLQRLAKPDAAAELAELLMAVAEQGRGGD
jgi:UDP-N-acetylglucosamine--N-acetylmuramyl-(pentapeptide) pyrophosphoryl-undecaprenol N-acetylglucosamine transferase